MRTSVNRCQRLWRLELTGEEWLTLFVRSPFPESHRIRALDSSGMCMECP